MTRFWRRLVAIAVLTAACPAGALGQAAWEYTPYEARLLLALESVPQLPMALVTTIGDSASARTSTVWGAALRLRVAAAPAKLRGTLLYELDKLTPDLVAAAAERQDLEADKLFWRRSLVAMERC